MKRSMGATRILAASVLMLPAVFAPACSAGSEEEELSIFCVCRDYQSVASRCGRQQQDFICCGARNGDLCTESTVYVDYHNRCQICGQDADTATCDAVSACVDGDPDHGCWENATGPL